MAVEVLNGRCKRGLVEVVMDDALGLEGITMGREGAMGGGGKR